MRRGFLAVAFLLLAGLLLACGGGTSAPPRDSPRPWAAGAQEWIAGVREAGAEGVPNLRPFLAPDVVLDHRATGGGLARGVGEALAVARELPYSRPGMQLHPPVYLSRTGLLFRVSWQGQSLFTVRDAVMVLRIAPRGVVREETLPSLVTGADRAVDGSGWPAALGLVQDYLVAREGRGPAMSVRSLGPGRGPAVFAAPDRSGTGFRRVVALVRTDDQAACPGHVAVSLRPGTSGRLARPTPRQVPLAAEEFRRIDDARRCLHGAARYDGWWRHMTIPEPVEHVLTGAVTVGDVTVEIWNGTPALDSLVSWALWRFRAVGLELPPVSSVTFYPSADRCLGNLALACGPERDAILACFGDDLACVSTPCPPWSSLARSVVLHEIAHTWVQQHVGLDTRAAYERLVGLRWEDRADPWEARALERATEVVAQGLRAEAPVRPLMHIAPASLEAEFTVLTGQEPVHQVG